jgi:hypothetical protein
MKKHQATQKVSETATAIGIIAGGVLAVVALATFATV